MRIIGGRYKTTKLYTLEGLDTRPTLDRVKEPLFSILNFDLAESKVLDLFAGSGALGLEAISRGAEKVVFCDNSKKAINIIQKNIEKVKADVEKVTVINNDYLKALEILKGKKFDIVFIDPPYKTDFAIIASEKIFEYKLLSKAGIIVIETDDKNRIEDEVNKLKVFDIYDERKYGRVHLIFLSRKG